MIHEGIYFVQWTEDLEFDEFMYKVYARRAGKVVFVGGYRTIEEAREASDYGRIHSYGGQC